MEVFKGKSLHVAALLMFYYKKVNEPFIINIHSYSFKQIGKQWCRRFFFFFFFSFGGGDGSRGGRYF